MHRSRLWAASLTTICLGKGGIDAPVLTTFRPCRQRLGRTSKPSETCFAADTVTPSLLLYLSHTFDVCNQDWAQAEGLQWGRTRRTPKLKKLQFPILLSFAVVTLLRLRVRSDALDQEEGRLEIDKVDSTMYWYIKIGIRDKAGGERRLSGTRQIVSVNAAPLFVLSPGLVSLSCVHAVKSWTRKANRQKKRTQTCKTTCLPAFNAFCFSCCLLLLVLRFINPIACTQSRAGPGR